MKHRFIIFQEITACRKSFVDVEAETQKEALNKLNKEEDSEFIDSYVMPETEEATGVTEIYDETGDNLLYHYGPVRE